MTYLHVLLTISVVDCISATASLMTLACLTSVPERAAIPLLLLRAAQELDANIPLKK